MPIPKEILDIVVCPEDRTPLVLADAPLLQAVNARIAEGGLVTVLGVPVTTPLAAALVRTDRTRLYPVEGSIPCLAPGDAIVWPDGSGPRGGRSGGTA